MGGDRRVSLRFLCLCALILTVTVACTLPGAGSGDQPPKGTSTLQIQRSSVPIPSFDFGNGIKTVQGASVDFSVLNEGPGSVQFGPSAVQVTGADAADFVVVSQPAPTTVASSSSTTFSIVFKPSRAAAESATITVTPTSGASSVTLPVSGTGVDFAVRLADSTVPTSYDFGVQTVNVAGNPVSFTIYNEGSTTVTVDSLSPSNADYTVGTPPPPTIGAGGTGSFTLVFTPSAAGSRSGSLTVSADSGSLTYPLGLGGTGTAGQVEVTDASGTTVLNDGATFDFGPVHATSTSATFRIWNESAGADVLSLSDFSLTGDLDAFGMTPPMGSTVSPGGTTHQDFMIAAGRQPGNIPDGPYAATITFQTSDAAHPTFTIHFSVYYYNGL